MEIIFNIGMDTVINFWHNFLLHQSINYITQYI